MTFLNVVTRGLQRRPVRTGLTLLGIAVGIGAVVSLIGLSRGLLTSWTAGMKSREAIAGGLALRRAIRRGS